MVRRLTKKCEQLIDATLEELERKITSTIIETTDHYLYPRPDAYEGTEPGDYLILFSSPGGTWRDDASPLVPLAPMDAPVAVAADLVANGVKIVGALTGTPPKKRDQKRLLKAITPTISVELSANFAHALVRLAKLEVGPSSDPELEPLKAGYEAAAELLREHFPPDAEGQSMIDEADRAYAAGKETHRIALKAMDEFEMHSAPTDMARSDFETHCTLRAAEMIPGSDEINMSELGPPPYRPADLLWLGLKWAPHWEMAIRGQHTIVAQFLVEPAAEEGVQNPESAEGGADPELPETARRGAPESLHGRARTGTEGGGIECPTCGQTFADFSAYEGHDCVGV